jgi:hypothetical protein
MPARRCPPTHRRCRNAVPRSGGGAIQRMKAKNVGGCLTWSLAASRFHTIPLWRSTRPRLPWARNKELAPFWPLVIVRAPVGSRDYWRSRRQYRTDLVDFFWRSRPWHGHPIGQPAQPSLVCVRCCGMPSGFFPTPHRCEAGLSRDAPTCVQLPSAFAGRAPRIAAFAFQTAHHALICRPSYRSQLATVVIGGSCSSTSRPLKNSPEGHFEKSG